MSVLDGLTSNLTNNVASYAQNAASNLVNQANNIVTLPTINVTAKAPAATVNTYKVAIQGPTGTVIFESSVPLSEERTATYQGFDITHLPTEIPAYKNTSSRKFSITGKFVSRNTAEATANSGYLDMIRSWLLPDYGNSGATPPILHLYGYKNNHITGVQCILKNYSFIFPDDVDYIYTGSNPMPVIGMVTLSLDEVFSPEQITEGAWKIKPPTVNRPPDAFGNGDSTFGSSSGGLSLGGITLGQIIPVATALVTAAKGGVAGSQALSSLAGYALSSAGSLIGSNPAVQSFVSTASSTIKSAVTTAEGTVQGALNSATQSIVGFTQSIGSSTSNSAISSSMAPISFGAGGAPSGSGSNSFGFTTGSYTADSTTTSF